MSQLCRAAQAEARQTAVSISECQFEVSLAWAMCGHHGQGNRALPKPEDQGSSQ